MTIRLVILFAFLGADLVALHGGSRDSRPFPLPHPEDVVAFTNGYPPGTGFTTFKRKEEIMRFLKYGKPKWGELFVYGYEPGTGPISEGDGVFLDKKGQFYFWSFNSPKVLLLKIPDGRYVFLDRRK